MDVHIRGGSTAILDWDGWPQAIKGKLGKLVIGERRQDWQVLRESRLSIKLGCCVSLRRPDSDEQTVDPTNRHKFGRRLYAGHLLARTGSWK